jgi:hypothetical protein
MLVLMHWLHLITARICKMLYVFVPYLCDPYINIMSNTICLVSHQIMSVDTVCSSHLNTSKNLSRNIAEKLKFVKHLECKKAHLWIIQHT